MKKGILETPSGKVKNYRAQAVQTDVLMRIIMAGLTGPLINVQPWNFMIVTERTILDSLSIKLPHAKMLHKAKAALIICGTPEKNELYSRDSWVMDYSAITRNILLACNAIGLGAVWVGAYPSKERIALVREILNIPKEVVPVNVIPIGVPGGTGQLREKFQKENIRWERW
ncbi:MAG: nitroreductase family protein [Nitrospiraceae bacterium]|nr:nitroreductase family protein [Nitrospiraceae bacterium]